MENHQFYTKDGTTWTEAEGIKEGLKTEGAIRPLHKPLQRSRPNVIIIGAGYAGLAAARECIQAGLSVLIIEARDRIGGRTWTANIDGHLYEMGGTWVHSVQPNTWSELTRYGLIHSLKRTPDDSNRETAYRSVRVNPGQTMKLPNSEEAKILRKIFTIFSNVDGEDGRKLIPLPYENGIQPGMTEAEFKYWTSLSCKDRLDQVSDQLSDFEMKLLKPMLETPSGAPIEESSFFDHLKWWSQGGYNFDGYFSSITTYKIKQGQSHLAKCMLQDIVSKSEPDKFGYMLNTIVEKIDAINSKVIVKNSQEIYQADSIICTIPLNVLGNIEFSPPLGNEKQKVVNQGHVNQVKKVHFEVEGSEWRSWGAIDCCGPMLFALGDSNPTPNSTAIVSFSALGNEQTSFDYTKDPKAAIDHLNSSGQAHKVIRVTTHDWTRDPYSKGAWFWGAPGKSSSKEDEIFRRPHHNVLFASSDSAFGWKGFIDGALEQGIVQARQVITKTPPIGSKL